MITTGTIKKEKLAARQRLASQYKKELRKKATPSEKKVYSILRVLYPSVQFQKAFISGPNIIIVDFYIPFPLGIVIELDGSHHYKGIQLAKDKSRDKWLKEKGLKVIRIKNKEIKNIDWKSLVETIKSVR